MTELPPQNLTEPVLPWREDTREGWIQQRCTKCGHAVWFPRDRCPACWSDDLHWEPAEGRGEVIASALVHRPHHPSFRVHTPFTILVAALPNGSLVCALARGSADPIAVGSTVLLTRGEGLLPDSVVPVAVAGEPRNA
ncbi:MAG: Zn-ribbon domain-containing OB-fold protein [Actinomycetota bacterium]